MCVCVCVCDSGYHSGAYSSSDHNADTDRQLPFIPNECHRQTVGILAAVPSLIVMPRNEHSCKGTVTSLHANECRNSSLAWLVDKTFWQTIIYQKICRTFGTSGHLASNICTLSVIIGYLSLTACNRLDDTQYLHDVVWRIKRYRSHGRGQRGVLGSQDCQSRDNFYRRWNSSAMYKQYNANSARQFTQYPWQLGEKEFQKLQRKFNFSLGLDSLQSRQRDRHPFNGLFSRAFWVSLHQKG